MMRRIWLFSSAALLAAFAQKYSGPRPEKPDLPYIKHADHLVATEAATAKQSASKNQTLYVIEGANSPAKTPLALPVFLLLADKLDPQRLGLYRLETKENHRDMTVAANERPEAIRLEVKRLDGNVYWIEVGDGLDPGEYALIPEGSAQAFCFAVF